MNNRVWRGVACALWLAIGAGAAQAQPDTCKDVLDARVPNSCVVAADTLWRGAKPDAAAATALLEAGVKTVVNLEWGHHDKAAFGAAKPDAAVAEVQYFRLPDFEPLVKFYPAKVDQHVARFIALTRSQPKPLYVHCRSGENRTGVMVAAWRIFNGTSMADAVAEMRRFKGIWSDADAKYLQTLTAEKRAAMEPAIALWQAKDKRDARIVCQAAGCQVLPD
jgi:hypothetical protein